MPPLCEKFEILGFSSSPTSTHSPQRIPVIQPLQFLHIPRGYYRFSNPQNWTDEGNTFGRGWEYSEANGISQRLFRSVRNTCAA